MTQQIQLDIINDQIPNGWVETTLGEVAEIIMWQSPKGESYNIIGKGMPFYQGVTEFWEKYVWIKTYTTEPTKIIEKWTILFSVRAPVWRVNFTRHKSCIGRWNAWLVMKSWEQEFLFYFLIFLEKNIQSRWSGTVFDSISGKELKEIPILLPTISAQKNIADVLSSFDNKIDLLREENKTLEQTAQTIFHEWFITNNNLKRQRLWDLVTVKRGWSPRPIQDYISETGLRWLKISDASATSSPYIFEIKEHIIKEGLKKTTLLNAGSLVLSNSATPWVPKILAVDSCIHDGWLHFPKSKFSNEFLYLLFQEIRPQLIQQGSGSVFTNLKTDILKDFEAPLPDDSLLDKFDRIVKPIFQKIFDNASQIQSLSQTRDELLPRLMKGEVRVKF